MAFKNGQRLPKGLDDGIRTAKKPKQKKQQQQSNNDDNDGEAPTTSTSTRSKPTPATTAKAAAAVATASAKDAPIPTIRPGERMSDFSARVDAALPVSGLMTKTAKGANGSKKDPLGLKVGRTKTEKKMHRMYDEWREQDRKIKEAREEAREIAEEEEEEGMGMGGWKKETSTYNQNDQNDDNNPSNNESKSKKSTKLKKRKRLIGELDDGDDDPWAKLKDLRGEQARTGLHDVVLAPPTFKALPREKFKGFGGKGAKVEVGNVPRASGSLRRREELGEVRRGVVEGYRALMRGKAEG